jgi:hypothetical protein
MDGVGGGGPDQEKGFFLKKEAKTFAPLSRTRRRAKSKSFLVLFFKKEPFPCFVLTRSAVPGLLPP